MESNKISSYAGSFLRKARKEKNMTGKELARLMNVSQQQISRYETGKTNLTLDQLSLLLVFLDKTWSDVIKVIQEEYDRDSKYIKNSHNYTSLSKYLVNNKFNCSG